MDNKEWVSRFYTDFLNKGNLEILDELVADDYIEHEPIPGFDLNKKGLKNYFEMMFTAFPDFTAKIDLMIEEQNKVVVYLSYMGTHKGEYMGMPASDKKIDFKAVDIIKIKNNQMVEHWGVLDIMTMMEQLDML